MAARIGACSLSSLNSTGRSYHLQPARPAAIATYSAGSYQPRSLPERVSMSASKNRPRWGELPERVRRQISELVGGRVEAAENCEGGFSPGFASRLTLADGRRTFVKAMDADEWPFQAPFHRDEARVSAALPQAVPAPRLLGSADDGHWVILAFECAEGAEPSIPWRRGQLVQVVAAAGAMSQALTPSPV